MFLRIQHPFQPERGLSISAELYEVFQFAEELRKELGHEHIEPLHLLAGVFEEKSAVYSDQLREAGVTLEELVLAKLREADENKTGDYE